MRRPLHLLGTVLAVAGVLTLLWALLVWQWQDPFTALYTKWKQHQLASQYVKRVAIVRHDDPGTDHGDRARRSSRAMRSGTA